MYVTNSYNTYLSVVFCEILVVSQIHKAVPQTVIGKSKIDNS